MLAVRHKTHTAVVTFAMAAALVAPIACGRKHENQTVVPTYDKETGKLSQLTLNSAKDGKPNITSYMNGSVVLRIEIDADEDGKIDRWEFYGPDAKVQRVGLSRSNDGKIDAWAYPGADGSIARIEVSTKPDRKPNRTEFYERGTLSRAEEDSDGDGVVDKWEEYESGVLATVSFDVTKSGKPTTTIDYRK